MIFFYKILVYCLLGVMLPILPVIYAISPKRRANMVARFGFKLEVPPKKGKRIWIHALSVGEVKSSLPFVIAYKKAYPDWSIIFTASTKTGFETAQAQFSGIEAAVDHLAYFPFDIGFCIRRVLHAIEPDGVVLTETDLWPNFLYEMKKRNLPVILINARLSKRSLKGYLLFKQMCLPFYQWLTHIMAQTEEDARRFGSLGIRSSRVSVSGNIKFDQPITAPDRSFLTDVETRMGIGNKTPVLLAGSTHEGEEKILLNVYRSLKNKIPALKMVIAPRNPDRCGKLVSMFMAEGTAAARFSVLEKDGDRDCVVFVDTLGLLAKLYAVCDVAFIGGSMVESGGHNPLEPAAFSKPVLFGRYMSDFLHISTLLLDSHGAFEAAGRPELEDMLERLLGDPDLRKTMGRNSGIVFFQHNGAVKRILQTMEQLEIV